MGKVVNVAVIDRRKSKCRKIVGVLMFVLLVGVFLIFPAQAAAQGVQIRLDGQKIDFDVKPYIDKNNRTMVPLRFIGERLGYSVGWNQANKEVTVVGRDSVIKLWAGQKEALVNNKQVNLDTFALVVNGRTMVPLRFILENLGVTVDFNPTTKVVNLFTGGIVPTPGPEQPRQTETLTGKTIIIDPGHGKVQPGGWPDPGAVGPSGLQEKDVVLDIGQRVVHKLADKGANVVITRTGNTNLTLAGRAAMANNNHADVFVSIHMNANFNRSYNGTAVYYYYGNQAAQNKNLAAVLQTHLVQALGLRDIGIIAEQFAVLRYTQVPAALVETAFISNVEEEKLAYTDEFREKAAQGITAGIEAYLTQ
jgi:N-acetylmuramoyl-L-alanine amidase